MLMLVNDPRVVVQVQELFRHVHAFTVHCHKATPGI